MDVHDFALLGNYRKPDLLEGTHRERFAVLALETHQCYIVSCCNQRAAYSYHPLIIIEIIGDSADYFTWWFHR